MSESQTTILADLQQRLTQERQEACDLQTVIEVFRQALCNRHEALGEKNAKLQHLAGIHAEFSPGHARDNFDIAHRDMPGTILT